jgi:hypothetical protein
MATQSTQPNQPWFRGDSNAGMKARVERIHKLRDPGTFADEILRFAKALLWLTLLFTGALCFFSYTQFLERFLPGTAAITAAAAITVVIEIGKQSIGLNALRMPFMQGWRYIFATPWNTGVFIGTTVFAVVIFSISVYNSTNGAAKYAENSAREKTEAAFVANTADIDAQISATQDRLSNAPKAKWKGREYYQDPKSVRAAETTLATLQRQREQSLQTQRSDFERGRNFNDNANTHSATLALRIGGWLELIQLVLMCLIASCERVLDGRSSIQSQPNNATTPQQQQQGIGFRQQQPVSAEQQQQAPRNQIGFNYGASQQATQPNPVSQIQTPVSQKSGLLSGKDADDAIRYHLNKVKREPANFRNAHAKPETVAKRMTDAIQAMCLCLHGVQSCSNAVYVEVREYLDRVAIPALNEHGYHFDTAELYHLLYQRAQEGTQA